MRTLASIAAVVALIATAGCGTTEKALRDKGQTPVTQLQLEERYKQPVKVAWTNDRNQSGTAAFMSDGTVRLDWPGGGASGKYRIAGGKFCTTYATIRDGKETCFTVYQTGPKETVSFFPDGSFNSSSREIE